MMDTLTPVNHVLKGRSLDVQGLHSSLNAVSYLSVFHGKQETQCDKSLLTPTNYVLWVGLLVGQGFHSRCLTDSGKRILYQITIVWTPLYNSWYCENSSSFKAILLI